MPKLTPQATLALPIEKNDAQAETIGQYLVALLSTLWDEEEGFSGKRPFGNSGWKGAVIHTLILNKAIDGELDEDGYIDDYDETQFDAVINPVFDLLKNADYTTLALPPEPKEYFLIGLDEDGEMSGYIEFPHTKEDAEKQLEVLEEGYPKGHWRIVHIPK